jgi:hypothetical protein
VYSDRIAYAGVIQSQGARGRILYSEPPADPLTDVPWR